MYVCMYVCMYIQYSVLEQSCSQCYNLSFSRNSGKSGKQGAIPPIQYV